MTRPPRRRGPSTTVLVVVILVLLGAVPSLLWSVGPRNSTAPPVRTDPRYASQSTQGARAAHIESQGDHHVDVANETCEGLGISGLAAMFEMPPDARGLARRFAADYEAAYRERAFRACLKGLTGVAG